MVKAFKFVEKVTQTEQELLEQQVLSQYLTEYHGVLAKLVEDGTVVTSGIPKPYLGIQADGVDGLKRVWLETACNTRQAKINLNDSQYRPRLVNFTVVEPKPKVITVYFPLGMSCDNTILSPRPGCDWVKAKLDVTQLRHWLGIVDTTRDELRAILKSPVFKVCNMFFLTDLYKLYVQLRTAPDDRKHLYSEKIQKSVGVAADAVSNTPNGWQLFKSYLASNLDNSEATFPDPFPANLYQSQVLAALNQRGIYPN